MDDRKRPLGSARQVELLLAGSRKRKLSRICINPDGELVRRESNTGFLAWTFAFIAWFSLDAALGFAQAGIILPVGLLLAALALIGLWDKQVDFQKHKHYRG